MFAAEQCAGEHAERVALPPEGGPDVDDRAEAFFAAVGADVGNGGDRAYFDPQADRITLPPRHTFMSREGCYGVVAHEHVHWSGGPSRLNRITHERFGDDPYAREELVAELGAVFVCAHLGLQHEPDPRQAAYLAHWTAHLKRKPRELWSVVGDASAALDYLIGDQRGTEAVQAAAA